MIIIVNNLFYSLNTKKRHAQVIEPLQKKKIHWIYKHILRILKGLKEPSGTKRKMELQENPRKCMCYTDVIEAHNCTPIP